MRSSPTIEDAVRRILIELEGVKPGQMVREGLRETPERVTKYLLEVTSGHGAKPEDVMKVFEDGADKVDQMVFQGNIPFYSLCEHHMVPFTGVAHMAYIPAKVSGTITAHLGCGKVTVADGRGYKQKILGLSKFSRLLDIFTQRLQVQERITNQVVDALVEHLNPQGAACVLRARHFCMECRGVKKVGSITMTSALRGAFLEDGVVRSEFMQFVQMAENRSQNI